MSPDQKPNQISLKPLAFLLAIVFTLWLISWWLVANLFCTPVDRGLFGDMFGGVNALFSGLATAGVVFALILQRKEISIALSGIARNESARQETESLLREHREALLKVTRLASLNILVDHYWREMDRAGGLAMPALHDKYAKKLRQLEKHLESAYLEALEPSPSSSEGLPK